MSTQPAAIQSMDRHRIYPLIAASHISMYRRRTVLAAVVVAVVTVIAIQLHSKRRTKAIYPHPLELMVRISDTSENSFFRCDYEEKGTSSSLQ